MELAMLGADDWPIAREVRLRALKDSPTAYIADYEEEVTVGEDRWRERFTRMHWVVARDTAWIVGMASSVRVAGRPPYERHIESVWVDPRYRRNGVLRFILAQLAAAEPAVTEWRVWVLDTNTVARQVYDRLGFSPTGERQLLADGSGRREIRLRFGR
ncbi:putative GNAT family acetyltransferase [Kribbella aluminosa]|uniref:GNAT family acetyltransferase n=1 Tax=Kribbella aluminosa TaxID=416017 RepID=A0ABS4USG0_9ACTN|nr:GNAT family N-acetyltransferase [Kribbella aluminosa]MBP2354489.1 putative GNAT family acetyltransferase [Kribbella aluminosa]